jgi:hypothetical protein
MLGFIDWDHKIDHPESRRQPTGQPDVGLGNGASSCTFFRAEIAVELAEQGISVFLGPIPPDVQQVLDLPTASVPEGLGPAEIDFQYDESRQQPLPQVHGRKQ